MILPLRSMRLIITLSMISTALGCFVLILSPFIENLYPALFIFPMIVTAIWIRFLSDLEREDFLRDASKCVGLIAIAVGTLFWLSFNTTYETSLRLYSAYVPCCVGEPLLPGIPFIPWLLFTIGSLSILLIQARRRQAALVFGVLSFGLLPPLLLADILPFIGAGGGWPLIWWGHNLSEPTLAPGLRLGGAMLFPFLLDWAFWSLLTTLLVCLAGVPLNPIMPSTSSTKKHYLQFPKLTKA